MLKKSAMWDISTACSRSQSSMMTTGLLPPSSRVTFLTVSAAALWISFPTSVDPVKATLSTSGWDEIAAPAVGEIKGVWSIFKCYINTRQPPNIWQIVIDNPRSRQKGLQINCGPMLWLFVLFAITSSTSKVVEKAVVPKWIHIFEMNGYRL